MHEFVLIRALLLCEFILPMRQFRFPGGHLNKIHDYGIKPQINGVVSALGFYEARNPSDTDEEIQVTSSTLQPWQGPLNWVDGSDMAACSLLGVRCESSLRAWSEMGIEITSFENDKYFICMSCVRYLKIDQNQDKCLIFLGNEICFVWEWQRNCPRHCFTWSWAPLHHRNMMWSRWRLSCDAWYDVILARRAHGACLQD